MGSQTLPGRDNGQIIDEGWFEIFNSALDGDLVPRTSGVATTLAGMLGTAALAWKRAHITTGYWKLGDIKAHHSYNGAFPAGEGWMLCDGRQITVATYEAEHGVGTWATYIGSTAASGLYLPVGTGSTFLCGVAQTTQTGSSAVAQIGANTINLTHSHGVAAHDHLMYTDGGSGANGTDGAGAALVGSPVNDSFQQLAIGGISRRVVGTLRTNSSSLQTSAVLSAAQAIIPKATEVEFYMRII